MTNRRAIQVLNVEELWKRRGTLKQQLCAFEDTVGEDENKPIIYPNLGNQSKTLESKKSNKEKNIPHIRKAIEQQYKYSKYLENRGKFNCNENQFCVVIDDINENEFDYLCILYNGRKQNNLESFFQSL